ncbi:MAG: TlpA disulfide reductase family protein [Rikenellaceae bacterium]
MKKLFLSLLSLAIMVSCSGSKPFIEGKIDGLTGTLYLYEYGWTSPVLIDSTTVNEDGSFKFEKGEKLEGEYGLRVDKKENRDVKRFFVDSDPVTVNGNLEMRHEIKIIGSVSDSLYRNYRQAGGAMSIDTTKKYVVQYRDFVVAPYIITRHMGRSASYQEIDSLLKLLPQNIQNTTYGKRARFIAEAQRNTEIGMPYMEIEESDNTGVVRKLSDEVKKNKYTLLTFWASWCGDCRDNIPFIREAYEKYKDQGFGVYSVSMDYTKAEWEGYVVTNELPWINVSDLKGWDCVPADKYFVQTITTTYIIGQDGKIIDKLLKKEALRNRIDELYGNMPTYIVPTTETL